MSYRVGSPASELSNNAASARSRCTSTSGAGAVLGAPVARPASSAACWATARARSEDAVSVPRMVSPMYTASPAIETSIASPTIEAESDARSPNGSRVRPVKGLSFIAGRPSRHLLLGVALELVVERLQADPERARRLGLV